MTSADNLARHWIGGELQGGADGTSTNPATGDVIGRYSNGDAAVADAAIAAAREAFRTSSWAHDPRRRARALHHLADAYEANAEKLRDVVCRENGKLVAEATEEVSLIAPALRFAAGLAVQDFGRVLETTPGQQSMVIRQPAGVVGIITPWNAPAFLSIKSLAPALAAGCTAVIKLPAQAAQTGAVMAEILASVEDLPRGLVNIVFEDGSDVSRRLVSSPDVATINYTGSTAVGRQILADAAPLFKRVGAELGGKTPHLVFADAEIEVAVAAVARSCMVFAGQHCFCGSRVLVQREIADEFVTALTKYLSQVRPGPAADPSSDLGPLIDKGAVARVDRLVEDAIAGGATVLVRGGPATAPELAGGAFYHPTLLEVDDSSLPIVQQEIFGPVQTVQRFDTEDEAVALANDSDYGLQACVWSRDVDRAVRIARRVETGLVSLNSWANCTIEMELEGWKSSGSGYLGGLASLDDFTVYKQITQTFA